MVAKDSVPDAETADQHPKRRRPIYRHLDTRHLLGLFDLQRKIEEACGSTGDIQFTGRRFIAPRAYTDVKFEGAFYRVSFIKLEDDLRQAS